MARTTCGLCSADLTRDGAVLIVTRTATRLKMTQDEIGVGIVVPASADPITDADLSGEEAIECAECGEVIDWPLTLVRLK